MKNYDFDLAKKMISDNIANLKSASLGMKEDWGWTAETIWEDGEFLKELEKDSKIAGINGSYWATPTIKLVFQDDSEIMFDCFYGESEGSKPLFM